MPGTAIATPLMQELSAAHALALECASRASRCLDSAAASGWNERASREAVRMGGLATRLMEGVGQVVPRLRGRLVVGEPEAVGAAAAKIPSAAPAASSTSKLHAAPGQRRGCLRNGNPAGDYLKSPRCGARTRTGCSCRQPAMANGRCRLHGGLSTGPRTPAGLARCRATRLTHGYRSREVTGLRRRAVHAARRLHSLTRALSAGYGVHRSDSVRSRTATPAPRQGAHMGAPLRKQPAGKLCSAGHGVHRSDSDDRGHAKTRSNSTATSASPRLRVESSAVGGALSAGHGVRRSFRDRLRSSALTLTLAQSAAVAGYSMLAAG